MLSTTASHAAPAAAAAPKEESDPARLTAHPNGCLTMSLHRPKALNALNLPMVRLLTKGLRSVREGAAAGKLGAPGSKCVLVYGEGDKAFCAGGDIRALAMPAHPKDPAQFFREEYVMNHLVSVCPSPYVSILRGITMGGGVGISVHGSVRVVTDNTMFAMPETGIGLFPDVGGTYFLPRLPGSIGMFLALTGQSLGAQDTMYAGVGTHFIPLDAIPAFVAEMESSTSATVEELLNRFALATVPPAKPDAKLQPFLQLRRVLIDRVFSAPTYEEVLARLDAASTDASLDESERKWSADIRRTLGTKSPTSLLITFHAMQEGKKARSLAEELQTELRLGARICCTGPGDFHEGVKAVLVDKKHKPQWAPMPSLQHIKDKYFAPFKPEEGIEELNIKQ
jgi:enoyl-CoA hydratase/carnithine racemase